MSKAIERIKSICVDDSEHQHHPRHLSIEGLILHGVHELLQNQKTTDHFAEVQAFHEKFKRDYGGPPRMLDELETKHRLQTMREEIDEYELAETLEDKFDALIDLVYFALGTAYLHGFRRFGTGFTRVHEANMKKELSTPENPGKRGLQNESFVGIDIVKPKDWQPPVLIDLL